MSLKVLCFGDNDFATQVVSKLRTEERQIDPEEQIIVDNVDINGKNFLIFCVKNSQLITSQSTGTTAIVYFLDVNIPIYQQKHLLFGILDQRKQFEGLPIIIAFDKDQYLQIKDIVNNFELFKVKDRASMIKQIDLSDRATINEVFSWIENQNQFNKTRTFDAPPKIVKMKPKYRQTEVEATQKKYEDIIRDKKLKGKKIAEQQEAYIENQKQRIKNENMQKQLANFNRNKKKMSPYDIKATPNPKIQANLHFFLKDPKVQKAQEANIKIQTDQFKQLPKPKPYVAKKTGINTGTQIQPTQLFDFDKQVRPILEILTTRALQTATLQIQENQQCLKIAKYKSAYNERVKKQKKHQSDNIQAQMKAIKEKQRILEFARKKDMNRRNIAKKQSYYTLANNFLSDIYKSAAVSLYQKNYYPDQYQHHLKTSYIPDVLQLALQSYQRIKQKQISLDKVFAEDIQKPIIQASKQPRITRQNIKKQKQNRLANKGQKFRYINIVYDHPNQTKFTSFAKYLDKQLEGTIQEYIKSRQEQIQQNQDKLTSGEIEEADMIKIKDKDDIAFAQNHKQYTIGTENQICFCTTQNKYQKPQKANSVVAGAFYFDAEGNVIQNIETCKKVNNKHTKTVNDLRVRSSQVNMDDGIVVNLENIPEEVCSVVFYVRIDDAGSYIGQNQAKSIKNACYGIQFYERAVPINKQNFGQKIKWQQLPKSAANQGQQGESAKKVQSMLIISYHLKRKSKQNWHYEQINKTTKLIQNTKLTELNDKITAFFKQSLQIFKVEEEVKPVAKTPSRGSKRKSRKNIKQQQKTPRKVQISLQSRILKQVQINLKQTWSNVFNKLGDEVIQWKQFIENSPDGWYFSFRGQKLQNLQQLKKFVKVGDLALMKVQPKVQSKSEQNIEEEDENRQNPDE